MDSDVPWRHCILPGMSLSPRDPQPFPEAFILVALSLDPPLSHGDLSPRPQSILAPHSCTFPPPLPLSLSLFPKLWIQWHLLYFSIPLCPSTNCHLILSWLFSSLLRSGSFAPIVSITMTTVGRRWGTGCDTGIIYIFPYMEGELTYGRCRNSLVIRWNRTPDDMMRFTICNIP